MKNTRVNVAIRVRPLLPLEIKRGETSTELMSVDTNTNSISISGRLDKHYSFDKVIGTEVSQSEVYDSLNINNYVKQVVDGYHATIFAYGQTGSGKTFTMEGYNYSANDDSKGDPKANIQDGEHIGIAPRVIKSMFSTINELSKNNNNTYRVY